MLSTHAARHAFVEPSTPKSPARRRVRNTLAATGVFSLMTIGAVALSTAPAYAATVTDVAMSTSNNATGATSVTYTWNFTPATSGTLTTLTMSVPTGTTVATALGLGTAYGVTGCSGTPTATLASTTVSLGTLTDCTVTSGTPVSIAISGFTNPPADDAVAGFQTAVTVNSDTGTASTGIDFNSNETEVTVVVPESLTFANDTTAITLLPIPGSATPAKASPVTLTVSTNATNGYSLTACVLAADTITQTSGGSETIPQLSTLGALSGTAFGAQVAVTAGANGTGGASTAEKIALQDDWADANGTDYLGYAALCDSGTNHTVATTGGTTDGDSIVFTNAATVSAIQSAGTYEGTISYQAVPSF